MSILATAVVALGAGCAPETTPGSSQPAGTSSETAVTVGTDTGAALDALRTLELGGGAASFTAEAAIAAGADASVASEIADARTATSAAAARCAGRNGVRSYSSWWQGRVSVVMLNSCNANRLAAALAGGAGTATLVGILSIVGVVPAGTVAALLGIGSAAIYYCSANGTGLEIHTAYYGSWCTNQ